MTYQIEDQLFKYATKEDDIEGCHENNPFKQGNNIKPKK